MSSLCQESYREPRYYRRWSTHERRARDARLRNASLTIHKMPMELVSEIFMCFVIHGAPSAQIAVLRSVCSYWNIIIMNTAGFWSTVTSSDPPRYRQTALSKSKEHYLTITFGFWVFPDDSSTYWDWLPAAMPRCRALHLGSYYCAPMQRLAEAPAPLLEEAVISLGSQEEALNYFAGDAPRLRRLHLSGTAMHWNSPVLSNLSELSIVNVHLHPPSIYDLLRILSDNPHLSSLDLQNLAMEANAEQHYPPIPLLSLKRIAIMLQPSMVAVLLRTLEIPNVTTFALAYNLLTEHETPVDFEPFATPEQHLYFLNRYIAPHFRRPAESLDVTTVVGGIRFTTYSSTQKPGRIPLATLMIKSFSITSLTKWITNVIPPQSIQLTRLRFQDFSIAEEIKEFEKLPSVKEIECYYCQWSVTSSVLQRLQAPTLAYPGLCSLSAVGVSIPPSTLLALVRDRYGKGENPAETLPARLETIDAPLTTLSKSEKEELQGILGSDVLKCLEIGPEIKVSEVPEEVQEAVDMTRVSEDPETVVVVEDEPLPVVVEE